jgi:hypothetical protein
MSCLINCNVGGDPVRNSNNSTKIALILLAYFCFLSGCQKEEAQNQLKSSDIFAVNSAIPAKIGKGWHHIEQTYSEPISRWRWTDQDAEIIVESLSNAKASISIVLKSFYKARQCDVMLGDKLLVSRSVPQDRAISIETPVDLNQGVNILRITSPDMSQAAATIPELKSHDVRKLSFAVFSITIKKI